MLEKPLWNRCGGLWSRKQLFYIAAIVWDKGFILLSAVAAKLTSTLASHSQRRSLLKIRTGLLGMGR